MVSDEFLGMDEPGKASKNIIKTQHEHIAEHHLIKNDPKIHDKIHMCNFWTIKKVPQSY